MAEVALSEILVAELPTKEVIFTPLRATVVREINTTIQPGQNEITLLGIDPRVDIDSIRIEGSGPAIITDIQTEIVPRREQFEDVYPSESDEEESSSDESSADEDGLDDPEMQEIRDEIADLEAKLARSRNDINGSLSVLNLMNEFGTSLRNEKVKNVAKLGEFLAMYNEMRAVESERHHGGRAEVVVGERYLARLLRKLERRKVQLQKEKRAAQKEARRKKEKRLRVRQTKTKQQNRIRYERRCYWTNDMGKLVVSLDSQSSAVTPGSSRRSSINEKQLVERSEKDNDTKGAINVMLRLSYIIPGPTWMSRYELSISTPSSSARMTYRAEFKNTCSETWKDTRVVLSTSQASFRGLEVRIPTLEIWNIRLDTAEKDSSKTQPSWNRILRSTPEVFPVRPQAKMLNNNNSLFGQKQTVSFGKPAPALNNPKPAVGGAFGGGGFGGGGFGNANAPKPNVQQSSGGLFGNANVQQTSGGGLFGNTNAQQSNQSSGGSLFGSSNPQQSSSAFGSATSNAFGPVNHQNVPADEDDADSNSDGGEKPPEPQGRGLFGGATADRNVYTTVELEDDDSEDTQTPATGSLEHQDSVKQEHGMTTTYEIPGHRTLAPSSVSRRHVLAEFDLKSVTLTYVIIPKHREAAFLRARIKNTSSVTLHPGRVGIRVDNTFVGTANVTTCAPNVHFTISLGIDPGIEVRYAKPTVKPISGGVFFNKEDGAKFRRSCWVKNTKVTAVDLIVSDQIPVTEDDKLRLNILEPQGLEKEGDETALQMEKRKGNGMAKLHKHGEVKWTLRLEPGQDIRLVLEYETKVPSGHDVSIA